MPFVRKIFFSGKMRFENFLGGFPACSKLSLRDRLKKKMLRRCAWNKASRAFRESSVSPFPRDEKKLAATIPTAFLRGNFFKKNLLTMLSDADYLLVQRVGLILSRRKKRTTTIKNQNEK